MKKKIKVEWCKNFIKALFSKLPKEITGIEVGLFWKKAEESGLWVRGEYGGPMSTALQELTDVKSVTNKGKHLYNAFILKASTK